MIGFEIKTKGFTEAIQRLDNYPQIAQEENRKAMHSAVSLVEAEAKKQAPVNLGFLRSKITSKVESEGPGAVVGVIGSYAPYARVVEEGADPHWPNVRGLRLWVVRKLQLQGDDADVATFLIGEAISRRGLKARPYLKPAIEENQGRIRNFFVTAMENIVRRLAG